jgi:DNA-directed RNA polymerase subunit RPC12/RpoP
MPNPSTPPLPDPATPAAKPGASIDSGKGRIFPCDRCGADLEFSIGQQSLQCPYCGSVKQIEIPADTPIVERDYLEMLDRLKRLREKQSQDDESSVAQHAIRCDSCGADVIFQGTLTSTHCPYCACPLQRDNIHDSVKRIPVDGVLPFLVPQAHAAENLRSWVQSLWWAPNEFLRQGANGKFNGVYLPFFTYDALTYTRYDGQRGDAYFVTVGQGNNQRQERRVRWTYASGEFQRFFDDVLIIAASKQQLDLVVGLEPWPLERMMPFTPEVLAGFFSRTYDVELEDGFRGARQQVDAALAADIRQRIGGDEQQISSQQTNYSAITYKHVLLPVWLLAYRYRDQTYQVMVNAATGEVSGQRPYSWVKITFAVVLAAILGGTIWAFSHSSGGVQFSFQESPVPATRHLVPPRSVDPRINGTGTAFACEAHRSSPRDEYADRGPVHIPGNG